MEQRRRTLLGASGHLTSTLDAVCICWPSHAGGTVHQTFNARRPCLTSGFSTCMEQPAVICQECTVTDHIPSRAEDCTFSVVIWQWLGNRDCTTRYNCCLPVTTDCRRFCHFCLLSFLFNFVWCPCNVFDVIVSPSSVHCYLLTWWGLAMGKLSYNNKPCMQMFREQRLGAKAITSS